jgi:flagellar biosynthesis protein FlhF
MKIKRFQATDVRQAIKEVRDVLGPDAVILSNTRVDGGIEIVAATDYDETAFQRPQPSRSNFDAPQQTKVEINPTPAPKTETVRMPQAENIWS